MTVWQDFDNIHKNLNPQEFYESVIVPLVSKDYCIETFSIQEDALYVLVSEHKKPISRQILIIQFQLDSEHCGFRVLNEQDQPINFQCPEELLIQSCNKNDLAFEWRDAHQSLSLQKKIALTIHKKSLHLADDFKTIKKWRKQLRQGMVIRNSVYGTVAFDRICPALTQFFFVLDEHNNEIYCHFNEFSIGEINSALDEWTAENFKPSIGF